MKNDAHSRPNDEAEELLFDPNVPTPTHGERAHTLLTSIRTGTLCTIGKEPAGYPYGSFVTFAMDGPNPVFFISELAEHTKNLHGDARASLLAAEGGDGDPLARGRVTLLGRGRRLGDGAERDGAKQAYLAAHPNAQYYVEYKDFAFWRIDVEAVRYIGGYGRMSWIDMPDWKSSEPDPIAPHAKMIIDHMNADHGDAMVGYCRVLTKAGDATAATMTSVDRYGFEMSVQTGRGPRPIRLAFSAPISTPDDARREMVALAKRVRSA